jgi:hypothetical protein
MSGKMGPSRVKRSRRDVIAGAIGAVGAVAAASVVDAQPAVAGTDGDVVLGGDNVETSSTRISNSRSGDDGLVVGASYRAIIGESSSGTGLLGDGATGVLGQGSVGVKGVSRASSGNGVEGSNLYGSGNGVYGHAKNSAVSGVFGKNDGAGNGVTGKTNNSGASGVYGQNDGTGYGVAGRANNGTGVLGESSSKTGVLGNGSVAGVSGKGGTYGVQGAVNGSDATGVWGENSGTGNGIVGRADTGTGVLAQSSNGVALSVEGLAFFSRSGVVGITYPDKSATVSVPGGVQPTSLAFATVQDNTGVYVKCAVPDESTGTVRIILSKAPGTSTAPKTATVGWFVANFLG